MQKADKRCVAPWINKMISFIKESYGLNSLSVKTDDGDRCYICGDTITIGLNFPLFADLADNRDVLSVIRGVTMHEISHALYTHFHASAMAAQCIRSGKMWPKEPEVKSSLMETIGKSDRHKAAVSKLYFKFHNIISDAQIEYLAFEHLSRFGGFIRGLKHCRKIHWESFADANAIVDDCNSEKDAVKRHEKMLRGMFDLTLCYAKFGKLKGADSALWASPMLRTIRDIEPYINGAVGCLDAETFFANVNNAYSALFDTYIRPYIDDMLEPNGDSEDQQMTDDASSGQQAQEQIREAIEKLLRDVDRSVISDIEAAQDVEDNMSDELSDAAASAKEVAKERNADDSPNSDVPSDSTCIERKETTSVWAGTKGGIEHIEKDEDFAADIRPDALKAIADAVGKDVRDFDDALSVPNIDFGNTHRGITIRCIRQKPTTSKAVLDMLYRSYAEYIATGKKAAHAIKPFLQPEDQILWERNRYFGSRFNAANAFNPSLRHFSRRVVTPQSPTLSISILVDESGSMYGNKIEAAKATSIALLEMCRELDVPFSVLGHSTDGEDCVIHSYAEFHADDGGERLLSMQSRGANRDGAALRYAAEILSKEQTDRHLLLIISDGQPSHMDYCGTAAEEDIRQIVKEYKMRNVAIIAAAIDQDKERIKGIYGQERYLAIDNVQSLPTELIRVVRQVMFA